MTERERLWHALGPEGQQAVRNIAQVFGPLDPARTAGRIGDEQVLGEDWRAGLLVMQPDGSLRRER